MPPSNQAGSVLAKLMRPVILVLSVALVLGVVAACQAEPTPTPTPLPTATPTPVPPTATPEPAPAAPMLTIGDIMEMASQEEQDCVKTAVGEDTYTMMQLAPFTPEMMTADAAASPVAACLSEETRAAIAAAVMGG